MKITHFRISRLAPIIFLVISLILVLVIFKEHKILAGGEEGLFFYNSQRSLELYNSPWFETGTGYPVPVFLPRVVVLFFASFLGHLGLPIWLIQSFLFLFLFFCGMYYVYLLAKELFKDRNIELTAISAAIFYFLNLYSMSQVWGRFLYAQFFTFTLLPIFTYYFIRFVSYFKFSDLVLLIFFSLVCSFAFGMPAQIITVWAPSVLWVIVKIFHDRYSFKKMSNSLGIFLIVVVIWSVTNIWWIYPLKELMSNTFSDMSNWKANFDSLGGVSKFFPTSQIILLRQGFLFGEESRRYFFYSHTVVYALSLILFMLTILGLVKSKKEKNWLYIFLLLLLGWFISKGSNSPFGSTFFKFVFSNFSFTQVFRNPYEKFGLVWVLAYSIFFGAGLTYFLEMAIGRGKYLVAMSIMLLSSVVLVWSLWSGELFNNFKLDIPASYKQVNDLIEIDNSDGRILVLPVHKGDGSLLNWGYSGVESSEYFFDNPTISKTLELNKTFNIKFNQLVDAINNGDDLTIFFDHFNVEYVIVHHDLKLERNQKEADDSEAEVSQMPRVSLVKKTGELSLYKYHSDNLSYFITDESAIRVNYQKISPTKYLVNIHNATKPFKLIFKTTFNDSWELRDGDKKIGKHFLIYDYANGWEINNEGNLKLEVVFKVWPWD